MNHFNWHASHLVCLLIWTLLYANNSKLRASSDSVTNKRFAIKSSIKRTPLKTIIEQARIRCHPKRRDVRNLIHPRGDSINLLVNIRLPVRPLSDIQFCGNATTIKRLVLIARERAPCSRNPEPSLRSWSGWRGAHRIYDVTVFSHPWPGGMLIFSSEVNRVENSERERPYLLRRCQPRRVIVSAPAREKD